MLPAHWCMVTSSTKNCLASSAFLPWEVPQVSSNNPNRWSLLDKKQVLSSRTVSKGRVFQCKARPQTSFLNRLLYNLIETGISFLMGLANLHILLWKLHIEIFLINFVSPFIWNCRICWLQFCWGVRPLPQWLSWIWNETIWWGSNPGVIGNVDYLFIVITPRRTLVWSSSTC